MAENGNSPFGLKQPLAENSLYVCVAQRGAKGVT
jgi:hypothetical protein